MKTITIALDLYEKGDRVLTPDGMATVLEDENPHLKKQGLGRYDKADRLSLANSEVQVELDEGSSSWKGRVGTMETSLFILKE
jgi:hypothetical protein